MFFGDLWGVETKEREKAGEGGPGRYGTEKEKRDNPENISYWDLQEEASDRGMELEATANPK